MNTENLIAKDAVIKGAKWLDEVDPKWFNRVDPKKLDLTSVCNCVLGQAYAHIDSDNGYWVVVQYPDAMPPTYYASSYLDFSKKLARLPKLTPISSISMEDAEAFGFAPSEDEQAEYDDEDPPAMSAFYLEPLWIAQINQRKENDGEDLG